MFRKSLSIKTLTIFTMLIGSCSLEQYVHQPVIQLSAKFPAGKSTKLPGMTKPLSEADNSSYVPPFVDRIHLNITGNDINGGEVIIDRTNTREDGILSNSFSFDEFPYGSDYSVTVEATLCDDSPAECNIPHITHQASASAQLIGSGSETLLLDIDLEPNRGPIDPVDLDFFVASDSSVPPSGIPPSMNYNLQIGEKGNFAFCWQNFTQSPNPNRYIKIFDHHKTVLSDNVRYVSNQSLCSFSDKKFIDVYVGENDEKLKVLKIPPPYTGADEPVSIYDNPLTTLPQSAIATGFGNVIVGWLTGNTPKFLLLDSDLNLLQSEPASTRPSIGEKLIIKILDINNFIVSGIQDNLIKAKVMSVFDSTNTQTPITITANGEIQNDTFFDYSAAVSGNSAVFVYESDLESGSTALKAVSYDTETDAVSGSFSPVFYNTTDIDYGQFDPYIENVRGEYFVLVWADNRDPDNLNAPFQIRYHLSDIADSDFQVWQDASNDLGSPMVAVNSDGFGIVSWFAATSPKRIHFKRFMF